MAHTDKASGCHQSLLTSFLQWGTMKPSWMGGHLLRSEPEFVGGQMSPVIPKSCRGEHLKTEFTAVNMYCFSWYFDDEKPLHPFFFH